VSHTAPPIRPASVGVIAPIRHIIPGLIILLLIASAVMAVGFYNVYALSGKSGDLQVLFMLATAVYPGPYLLYGVYCFFLFHGYESRAATVIYYVSCALLAVAPLVTVMRNLQHPALSLGQQLDAAMWQNFVASLVIVAVFGWIEYLVARVSGSRRHSYL
jgi:hypothetical protein